MIEIGVSSIFLDSEGYFLKDNWSNFQAGFVGFSMKYFQKIFKYVICFLNWVLCLLRFINIWKKKPINSFSSFMNHNKKYIWSIICGLKVSAHFSPQTKKNIKSSTLSQSIHFSQARALWFPNVQHPWQMWIALGVVQNLRGQDERVGGQKMPNIVQIQGEKKSLWK